jgi:CRP-like cAMP-binding protein
MDLLERARALAACPLFANLAPAVVIRLADRARPSELEAGERRTTDDNVRVVASGSLAIVARGEAAIDASVSSMKRKGSVATPGQAVGLIRVIAPATPVVEAIADRASVVLSLGLDDVRDVLEEDPIALSALADALARLLLDRSPDESAE